MASGWRKLRPRPDETSFELAQGAVEWGLAHRADTVTAAIDWRLMVIAMQLRFFVRPLRFPKKVGRDEVVSWALAYVHYCGGDLSPPIEAQLDEGTPFIMPDPSRLNGRVSRASSITT